MNNIPSNILDLLNNINFSNFVDVLSAQQASFIYPIFPSNKPLLNPRININSIENTNGDFLVEILPRELNLPFVGIMKQDNNWIYVHENRQESGSIWNFLAEIDNNRYHYQI